MFYAILVSVYCSGFQCEIGIENQWQAPTFEEVKTQCEDTVQDDVRRGQCMYYYEDLEDIE